MAAVTYGAHTAVETAKPRAATTKGKSALVRFFEAIADARLRQAEREIAMHRHLLPADFEIAGHKINERSEDTLPFVR
jgi:hypothetical protein